MATVNGPFAVNLGTTLLLAPPQASGVYFSLLRIDNSSPFIATVTVAGDQFFLLPFTYDIYSLPANGAPVTAAFAQIPGGSGGSAGQNSFCTTTWFAPPDRITDSYPGSLTSAAITATIIGTLPSVPSSAGTPTATLTGSTATLTWTAPTSPGSSPITGYSVLPYLGGTPQGAQMFNTTATTQNITGLGVGSWTFTVAAVTLAGTGPYSAASNTVVVALPDAPTIGTTTLAGTTASVNWTAPGNTGSSPITGYSVVPYLNSVAQVAQVFGTATTENIAGLNVGSWTFAVAAITLVGMGSYSTQSNAVVVTVTITISKVGQWSETVGGQNTLNVSPVNLQDLMVCEVQAGQATALSGGGVTTWHQIGTSIEAPNYAYLSIWWGIVTTTGAGTITVAQGAGGLSIVCTEFTTSSGAAQTWTVVTSNSGTGGPATSGNYASVSPTGSGQLYIGALYSAGNTGGSQTGFVYYNTAGTQVVYNLTPPTPSAPPWTATSGYWATFSALMQGT